MEKLPFNFEDAARLRLTSYGCKAEALYPQLKQYKRFRKIRLIFTDDPKTDAGQCWRSSWTIELNKAYIPLFTDVMLDQILGHELCHIITPLLYGNDYDGHCVQWKWAMMAMGFKPETYHEMYLEEL